MAEIIQHIINYSLDELKEIAKTGEVYRKYPKNPKYVYAEIVPYLDKITADIKVSNLGNIKINGDIVSPYKENGNYYVLLQEKIAYKVYRLVAETWCEFPNTEKKDGEIWDVHHIINDGPNIPCNLIWVKREIHKQI